ncbi:hypothetical protein [Azoarcus sp. KH32C]|uniref:hypothetical protein n=1 Tax=Azoarcus sp. KH32C TaxID=748247 RepID=UPI0002386412|nr:hypothetical protein [Azoarcus sp. KH32C]BAL25729.1 hypothetical protein AZKH_3440 [Azoarcus sp. KH32C]
MKNKNHRISRRVLQHFLHLAAASFALGNLGPANADDDDAQPPARQFDEASRTGARSEGVRRSAYLHSFALPATHAVVVTGPLARVRVLDTTGRPVTQVALDGASAIGPFADGAYTVLIKANGLTEMHRIRIGPDTRPYLQFSEPA